MILPGETEAGTAGTQPCRGISRWAHRDDERGREEREDSSLRRPTSIGSKDPYALKIPARRAEYSLTENVASPFQAEPRHRRLPRRVLLFTHGRETSPMALTAIRIVILLACALVLSSLTLIIFVIVSWFSLKWRSDVLR